MSVTDLNVAINENGDRAKEAVARLTDQGELVKVALRAKSREACFAAVEALDNKEAIARVAVEAPDPWIRKHLVMKLTDQDLLYEIAIKDKKFEVRNAALGLLTEQKLLRDVALYAPGDMRWRAVGKLTDATMLAYLALYSNVYWVRSPAKKRLDQLGIKVPEPEETDDNAFVVVNGELRGWFGLGKAYIPNTVATFDERPLWPNLKPGISIFYYVWKQEPSDGCSHDPRMQAVEIDTSLLKKKNLDNYLAGMAIAECDDLQELRFVVQNDKRATVRRRAINKMQTEEAFFLEVALHDPADSVRLAASRRLSSDSALDTLLKNGTGSVQVQAARRTGNMKLLAECASASRNGALHRIALGRVKAWTFSRLFAILGKTVNATNKGMVREHILPLMKEWLHADGPAQISADQRLFTDAILHDYMLYTYMMEYITDSDCIADILCALSPHEAGATYYGPAGERGCIYPAYYHKPRRQRVMDALDRICDPVALKKVADQAKTKMLRDEAKKRLDALQ